MASTFCIGEDFKTVLKTMIEGGTETPAIIAVLQAAPFCPGESPHTKAAREATRTAPEQWPAAVYIDESGNVEEWASVSKLAKDGLGLEISGKVICDIEGRECRPESVPEILRAHGYTVQGDGEPAPAVPETASAKQRAQIWKDWKEKLNREGLLINVYNPKFVAGATKVAPKRAPRKK